MIQLKVLINDMNELLNNIQYLFIQNQQLPIHQMIYFSIYISIILYHPLLILVYNIMSLRQSIINVLDVLKRGISQIPLDKQPPLAHKIERIMKKYQKPQMPNREVGLLKELQFQINFLKLSFPNINLNQKEAVQSEKEGQSKAKQQQQALFELQNKQQVLQFVKQTEKALDGVREQVSFSNWTAGNLDPQDLKRHKQLLKRQYFAGQYWEGKQKPASPTAAYLSAMMQGEPQMPIQNRRVENSSDSEFSFDPDKNWEKVKR